MTHPHTYHHPNPRTPAEIVVTRFGSMSNVAKVCGVAISTVMRWVKGSGFIPAQHYETLLAAAHAQKIPLGLEELMLGIPDKRQGKRKKTSQ